MFKIGQKVVCKDLSDTNTHYPYGIEKGKIYTIDSITKCNCGRELLILNEVVSYYGKECNSCFSKVHERAFYSFRFEPIKYEIISNKEIIKEVIYEKSDLPIKEPVLN